MATERNRGNKGNKKERKHMLLQMVGNVEKISTFGDSGGHTRFTLIDSVSETKLPFLSFHTTDLQYDALCESEDENKMVTVTFDIGYNNYKGNLNMQLVATEIEKR